MLGWSLMIMEKYNEKNVKLISYCTCLNQILIGIYMNVQDLTDNSKLLIWIFNIKNVFGYRVIYKPLYFLVMYISYVMFI